MPPPVPTTLRHAFAVLEAISQAGPGGLSAAEVADATGLNPRTAFRHLASLRELKLVEAVEGRSAHYRVGAGTRALAASASARRQLMRMAEGRVAQVADALGTTAHVTTYDEGTAVTVAVAVRTSAQMTSPALLPAPGSRRPAHASASGKLFLAHNRAIARSYLMRPMQSFTPHTIHDPGALYDELDAVRSRGWSSDNQELELGLCCLAVPVWGERGRVVGSVVVSTAQATMSVLAREALLAELLPAARDFTRALGGATSP